MVGGGNFSKGEMKYRSPQILEKLGQIYITADIN